MSQAVWEGIRPHLPDATTIDFTGGGEPLLQPNLVAWVREAKAAGCETGILTNGLLLKESLARDLLDAGLDMVCVSMDGATAETYNEIRIGSNFDTVCENLRRLNDMRNGATPKTMINFVLMPMNVHQVEEMVQLAQRLGVDQINFKQCDVIRGDQGRGFGLFRDKASKEVDRLRKALAKTRSRAKKLNIRTTAFSFLPEELPVCEQDPRDSVFIRHDGAAGPCINLAIGGPTTFLGKDVTMPTVHYGRIPDQDLLDLFETETCRFYRDRFEERVKAHEEALLKGMTGGGTGRQRALQEAREAMPEAAEGCKVCHYLYDI
jgi:MoaA/NifB/PqqE/SkfB family radical SAM enzyme